MITDPYQTIRHHKVHLFTYLMLSRGDISTRVYLENANKYKYDSFIFGSSRSCSHTSKDWAKYLSKNNVPFSFGAWNESAEGIYRRLRLIDSLHQPIRNAFILFDVDRTFEPGDGITWDHYLITGKSRYNYNINNYLVYLKDPRLVLTSVDYSLFHQQRGYMKDFVGMKPGDLDPINNDWEPNSEQKILADSANYYRNSAYKFYERPAIQQISKKQIDAPKEDYLKKIYALLLKHHTKYRIVIAPLYDQVKMNPTDMQIITRIFGPSNVFDFSGINGITNDKTNYNSDVIHYRKKVGKRIFKIIY